MVDMESDYRMRNEEGPEIQECTTENLKLKGSVPIITARDPTTKLGPSLNSKNVIIRRDDNTKPIVEAITFKILSAYLTTTATKRPPKLWNNIAIHVQTVYP